MGRLLFLRTPLTALAPTCLKNLKNVQNVMTILKKYRLGVRNWRSKRFFVKKFKHKKNVLCPRRFYLRVCRRPDSIKKQNSDEDKKTKFWNQFVTKFGSKSSFLIGFWWFDRENTVEKSFSSTILPPALNGIAVSSPDMI